MEAFLYIACSIALFALGLALGAILENRLARHHAQVEQNMHITQEMLLPLASKIEHIDARCEQLVNATLVDYEMKDPDETLELPAISKEEPWPEKQEN